MRVACHFLSHDNLRLSLQVKASFHLLQSIVSFHDELCYQGPLRFSERTVAASTYYDSHYLNIAEDVNSEVMVATLTMYPQMQNHNGINQINDLNLLL